MSLAEQPYVSSKDNLLVSKLFEFSYLSSGCVVSLRLSASGRSIMVFGQNPEGVDSIAELM